MSDTKEKTGWFARLKKGLKKTQVNLVGIFTGGVVDEAFLEELEFQLIASDVGVEASAKILVCATESNSKVLKHRTK